MNREEIKNRIREQTDLIRYPFDEFWFDVGFDESEKRTLNLIDGWNNFWNSHLRGNIGLLWWNKKIKELKDSITAK